MIGILVWMFGIPYRLYLSGCERRDRMVGIARTLFNLCYEMAAMAITLTSLVFIGIIVAGGHESFTPRVLSDDMKQDWVLWIVDRLLAPFYTP